MIIRITRNMFGKPPRLEAALIPSTPAKLIRIQVMRAIETPQTTLSQFGDSCSSWVIPFVQRPDIALVFESEAVTKEMNTMNV